jgi:3',5'-cyclic AMP phosphodiesterase CpdA
VSATRPAAFGACTRWKKDYKSKRVRIAHISDLHVLALEGAVPFRLFNKRATGYANIRYKRKHAHKSELVRRVAQHLAASKVDHVVISGDVSNLALEAEFEAVRNLLDDALGLPPSSVTLVPGNHDVYTRGAERKRRFAGYFERYLASDLPELGTDQPGGLFPVVKLAGHVAVIGLSSALARPPFVASGRLGDAQLRALGEILRSREVRERFPIIVLHHPVHNPPTWLKSKLEGLADADRLKQLLLPLERGLVLHGHLHRRIHRRLSTYGGYFEVIGATSASLIHPSPERMGGYNLYEVTSGGEVASLESYVYDEAKQDFTRAALPRVS